MHIATLILRFNIVDFEAAEPGSPWISTLSARAVHLYGPPTEQGSLGQDDYHVPYQFYPSLNFICTGTILKLYFVANETGHGGSIMSPEFLLVRGMAKCHAPATEQCEYHLISLNAERTQQPRCLRSMDGVGLYEIEIPVSSLNIFNSGDILGVHYPRLTSGNDSILTILYQNGGGYYDTLDCRNVNINECNYTQKPILPYIAIETQSLSAAGQFACILISIAFSS